MIRLEDKELNKLIPLCRKDDYILGSILTGVYQGHALVDDPFKPKRAFICHTHGGFMSYVGEEPDDAMAKEIADEAIAYRSDRDFVNWVEFNHYPEKAASLIESKIDGVRRIERIIWTHDEEAFKLAPKPSIQEDIVISLITKDDFKDEDIRFENMIFWDEAEDMIDYSIGFKALKDGELIGLCTAAGAAYNHYEIDIATSKKLHRQGIGYAMAHAFITECYRQGKRPGWDCVSTNEASKALAEKLGFKKVSQYKLLAWSYES